MAATPPPRLDPKQLFEKRFRRDQARLRAYNQLLEQIHQRIYTTSQLTGNASYISYTIPPFIFGLPKIDLEDCVVYLVYMLRQSGYEVRFTYPNLLYISWKHHERNYFLNQNPILQAMIPPEAKKDQRKKAAQDKAKSVSFAPDLRGGSLGGREGFPEPREPPVRNAMEYVPPNSFVQNVQKPLPEKKTNILADLWNYT